MNVARYNLTIRITQPYVMEPDYTKVLAVITTSRYLTGQRNQSFRREMNWSRQHVTASATTCRLIRGNST